MFRQLFLLLIAASANATTFFPELHECPVCGVKSVTMSLGSYTQIGGLARDLSYLPQFEFVNVNVCPGDLYASWSDAWETVDAEEKARLAAFLKKPALRLTDAEKSAIAGHEKAFRESRWFKPLWARTCDEFRRADDRRKFWNVLRLHYAEDGDSDPENWEKQLDSLFRENAIAALKDSVAADWPTPGEKRVFAYHRAELTRQAGRDSEAFALFQEIIAAEKAVKPDDGLECISLWASEQGFRSSPDAKDPEKLLAAIIPELPDPWRDPKAAADARWPRHFAAVDILARRGATGEKPFSEALWKLLDRKPGRLLALLKTCDADLSPLRQADPRWRDWFDETAALLASGKLPPSLADDPNDTRVAYVLRRAVGSDEDGKTWRSDVLLPAVRKAATEGGIPTLKMPKDDSLPTLPPIDGNGADVTQLPTRRLDQELWKLWQEQPSSVQMDIATIYIRFLHLAEETHETTGYPAMYFLPAVAETEEGRAAIRKELGDTWKSSFWKAACAYAARHPDSTKALIRHPFTASADDELIFTLLGQQADPSWKDAAIRKLNEEGWGSSDLVAYLALLKLPEAESALDAAASRLRNPKDYPKRHGIPDGKLQTLREIEKCRVKARLAALPVP